MTYVDHNPEDPTMISRNFKDPFERLKNIQERLAKGKYLDITIGCGGTDKYLYELYYDMIFMRSILSRLGVMDNIPPTTYGDVGSNSGISKVVAKIAENVKSGDVALWAEDL